MSTSMSTTQAHYVDTKEWRSGSDLRPGTRSGSRRSSAAGSMSWARDVKQRAAYLSPPGAVPVTPASRLGRPTLTPASRQGPPQRDEDAETVLDLDLDDLPFDDTGRRTYTRACEKLGVVPSSSVLAKLANSKVIDCKHYGMGPKGTMALAIALVINNRVTSINLQGNDIGTAGVNFIQKMVSESHSITDLDISDNKLGRFAAIAISRMLADNKSLRRLDISNNGFLDADAALLATAIQGHPELLEVNLSHNNFGDASSHLFEDMLADNESVQSLNLSWNQFRVKGTSNIASGLKDNASLKHFDFSWNGFGDGGAADFARALRANHILSSLDVTACRIGHDGFIQIISALGVNEGLTQLKIGRNNIRQEIAEAGLTLLGSSPTLKLETLDMSDCTFSTKFDSHIANLNEVHPRVKVVYGYAETYGKAKTNVTADILREGMECLRDFCKETGIALVDLFERFDADNSMSVSMQEFQDGLKDAGVPLSLYKIEMFAHALDQDGDGDIDYSELVLQMKERLN